MPLGGYSYDPTARTDMTQGTAARAALSPQEAVKMLSLRLPKSPQNSPVPSQLLNAQGGGGINSLAALLQALMRAQGGQGQREEVLGQAPMGIDNGFSPSNIRSFNTMPHITVADGGDRSRVDEAPSPDAPLFDSGIPRIRNMVAGAPPLF